MKSVFLFTYRMSGGQLSTLPVYATTLAEAVAAFHRRMANDFGCESDKYRVLRHREIPERAIHFTLDGHHRIVEWLTSDDQQEFFNDRRARQLQERGYADKKTDQFFQQEQVA